MKELSIEEKAKRYDEALKVLHKYDGAHIMFTQDLKEEMFPELREVSEDERIRKELIAYCKVNMGLTWHSIKQEDYIAWLEKQVPIIEEAEKEKNDYVSGQFLYCKGSFNEFKEGESYWIEYIGNDTYIGRSDNILNQKFHITPRQLYTWLDPRHPEKQDEQKPIKEHNICNTCEEKASCIIPCPMKLVELEHADKIEPKFKAGDKVLADGKVYTIKLVNEDNYIVDENGRDVQEHFSYTKDWKLYEQNPIDKVEPKFKIGQTIVYKGTEIITPTKMTISDIVKGQYWDDNCCIVPISDQDNWELVEQKSNNKGEPKFNVGEGHGSPAKVKEISSELLRLANQQNPVWSVEDDIMKHHCHQMLALLRPNSSELIKDIIDNCHHWLNSIKSKVHPKIEWSERDELMLEASIGFIKSSPYPYSGDTFRGEISKIDAENWLETLKYRVQPQPKEEWAEEDENRFKNLIELVKQSNEGIGTKVGFVKFINRLKSLKPQPKQERCKEDNTN